jgi:hypothetical protein
MENVLSFGVMTAIDDFLAVLIVDLCCVRYEVIVWLRYYHAYYVLPAAA